jgi:hypothetical protein
MTEARTKNRDVGNGKSSTLGAPQGHWRWVVVLPAVTVLLFVGLSAVSFIEIKTRKPEGRLSAAPVSAEVLSRYQAKSKELERNREKSRESLTGEEILSALNAKKAEEIPLPEKVTSDLKSLEKRVKGATALLIPQLLSVLKRAANQEGAQLRVAKVEAVICEAIFSNTEPVRLGEAERGDLWAVLEGAVQRQSKASAALLVLLSQLGKGPDAERLMALREKAATPQLSHEISKVLRTLEKKEVATSQEAGR